MMLWLIVIVILLAVGAAGFYISTYNGMVKSRNWTEEAWSQIDVQLKRRNDLIPNLLSTVKGYAKHEQETLEKVIKMRNQLVEMPADNRQETMAVSNQLTDSLKSIFALSESYPDLKANAEFGKLMEELTNTENKIAYARQLFNSSATRFNNKIETFPGNVLAGAHNFQKVAYLETPTEEKAVPKVSFD
ncbi:Protein LemA [Latilactobacillus fuchuensis]|jgi:LemA protein|uniref:Protein LemA n=3 Tax=Latilactobacillus fuchuensis TaxID=164393 RepID=A0A2N9DTF2_9LACO|nr:lemA family protein [Latilactobacillus fuchuensis DSM 14340 = JCM 11249]SPC36846.1 Protein LemA [Latilactobacillus fuchuensis]